MLSNGTRGIQPESVIYLPFIAGAKTAPCPRKWDAF